MPLCWLRPAPVTGVGWQPTLPPAQQGGRLLVHLPVERCVPWPDVHHAALSLESAWVPVLALCLKHLQVRGLCALEAPQQGPALVIFADAHLQGGQRDVVGCMCNVRARQ
jgi:hypothetical protein